jgi:dienelactone hydrolase
MVLITGGRLVMPFLTGWSLVVRGADVNGFQRTIADLAKGATSEHVLVIPLGTREIRARLYRPSGSSRQTVLLTPGVQPGGIDDDRLMRLARELAATGVTVLTPGFPELSALEITTGLTDGIEQAAVWLATQPALTPRGRIGMMGVSFSAGLTVVAAGRPSLRDRVLFVFAFGGHDDLPTVLRYLATGIEDLSEDRHEWRRQQPHQYGVAILTHSVAERLVPAEQVALLRSAVARFIAASYAERQDRAHSRQQLQDLRKLTGSLPEPSSGLVGDLLDGRLDRLGTRLLPAICFFGEEPALSPSRSPLPAAPVFLMHGAADSLIPARESERLAARLRGHPRVRLLVTKAITHAEASRHAAALDVVALARFWSDILDE